MNNTNLFKHSNKELVTDAFLTWIIYFLDADKNLKNSDKNLFKTLLLKEEDKEKNINSIQVSKQIKGKNGRPDIVVSFKLGDEKKSILFENKTWTTTSIKQLGGYREDYGDLYRFFYLKLGYVNIREKKICEETGYDIISSKTFYDSILDMTEYHPFIDQYAEYIRYTFVDKIIDLEKRLFEDGDFKALSDAQGQQILFSKLYQNFENLGIEGMQFKTGSSSGRPWTEINICSKDISYNVEKEEKTIGETIFWRVDIRSGKYYIRLNQYTYNPSKEYLPVKKQRLSKLREVLKNILSNYNQLKMGHLANRGNAESEIVIFFEHENTIKDLLDLLPLVTREFIDIFYSTDI